MHLKYLEINGHKNHTNNPQRVQIHLLEPTN